MSSLALYRTLGIWIMIGWYHSVTKYKFSHQYISYYKTITNNINRQFIFQINRNSFKIKYIIIWNYFQNQFDIAPTWFERRVEVKFIFERFIIRINTSLITWSGNFGLPNNLLVWSYCLSVLNKKMHSVLYHLFCKAVVDGTCKTAKEDVLKNIADLLTKILGMMKGEGLLYGFIY